MERAYLHYTGSTLGIVRHYTGNRWELTLERFLKDILVWIEATLDPFEDFSSLKFFWLTQLN